jgi:hypothetical protein
MKVDAKLDTKVGERETDLFAIGAVIFPMFVKESCRKRGVPQNAGKTQKEKP